MRKMLALGSAVLMLAAAPLGAAPQGTQSAQLQVSAHVVRSCLISVSPIDFGNYDSLVVNKTQPLDSDTLLQVQCSKGIGAKIDLDTGANAQGTARHMAAGGEYLAYEIYQSSAHAQVWGSGTQSRTIQAMSSPGAIQGIGAYGRIAAGQYVTPADYTDTVTITLNF